MLERACYSSTSQTVGGEGLAKRQPGQDWKLALEVLNPRG